jgi:hypothetical protein
LSLLALQADFHLWLTAEADGLGARLARASAPGLAVYLNNYRGQLIGCLKTSYPALYAWLGQSSFEAAAATHIDRSPPRDWTLDAYALGFPGTLTTLFPNDPEVTELALLERQLDLAFIGPDAAPIDLGVLGDVDWDRAVLDLVPTFVTRVFATNACAIWSAIDVGENPPPASPLDEPVCVAIWRDGFMPTFRSLEQLESIGLGMVRDGRRFGEICTAIVDLVGPGDGLRTAGEFLAEWMRSGIIRSIES